MRELASIAHAEQMVLEADAERLAVAEQNAKEAQAKEAQAEQMFGSLLRDIDQSNSKRELTVQDARAELEQVNEQLAATQLELNSVSALNTQLEAVVSELEQLLNQAQEGVQRSEAEVLSQSETIDGLRKQLEADALQGQVNVRQAADQVEIHAQRVKVVETELQLLKNSGIESAEMKAATDSLRLQLSEAETKAQSDKEMIAALQEQLLDTQKQLDKEESQKRLLEVQRQFAASEHELTTLRRAVKSCSTPRSTPRSKISRPSASDLDFLE